MVNRRFSFIDVTLWSLTLYLLLHVPHIETRVDESEHPAPMEQPPASTPKPEPHKQYLNNEGKCFHMPSSECPPEPNCTKVDSKSVFCCDLDSARLKEALASTITQNTKYLHVYNSTVDELDVSQLTFNQLTSMAFTDGNIGKIVGEGQYLKSIACLNISNNDLTTAKLQQSTQLPLADLFHLSVLDLSGNNLTDFPNNFVHGNREISIDLSGNNHIHCKSFIQAVALMNNITFLNYDHTFCTLEINFNWFKEVRIVQLKQVNVHKEILKSCRNIKPANSNCSCRPHRMELLDRGGAIIHVAVDCSHRHLTAMPTNLPPHTMKLDVSYNHITSLENVKESSYNSVRDLMVDYNNISNISELAETSFIKNLISFSIGHNKLTTIDTHIFSHMTSGYAPVLQIAGNIIHCQCDTAKTLKPWLLRYTVNILDYDELKCEDNTPVIELNEDKVCP